MTMSRRMELEGHVARMVRRGMHILLVGNPEGKRPLGTPGRRGVANIKTDLRQIEWVVMDWIDLTEDSDQ
jgi:hypothetical protein